MAHGGHGARGRNMHYGNELAAKATVDHILSYMRSIPSWAYNGGAQL